jgi:hypothetical protein
VLAEFTRKGEKGAIAVAGTNGRCCERETASDGCKKTSEV